jgi:hypothetical protein
MRLGNFVAGNFGRSANRRLTLPSASEGQGGQTRRTFDPTSGNTTVYAERLTVYAGFMVRFPALWARRFSFAVFYGVCSFWVGGCGLLIGNVKPVEQKSDTYGIMELPKAEWKKLDPLAAGAGEESRDPETTKTEISDAAFQSQKSAAIISINSSCRPALAGQGGDATAEESQAELRKLSYLLLLGISDFTDRTERNLTIQSVPALETTVQGKMSGAPIRLRTVVLKRDACVFDLMYMAEPTRFAASEKDFSDFVASLRVK